MYLVSWFLQRELHFSPKSVCYKDEGTAPCKRNGGKKNQPTFCGGTRQVKQPPTVKHIPFSNQTALIYFKKKLINILPKSKNGNQPEKDSDAAQSLFVGGKMSAPAATQLLDLHSARALVDSVEAFLFDCDGVIWKGDKLIDGVPETLDLLRSKGKKLVFVTNNSTKSRRQYAAKFHSLGISVSEVYVIGMEGIVKELEQAGFTAIGGPEDAEKRAEWKSNTLFEHDKSVGAVVVGLDPYVNYHKLQYATLCVRENPGCLFIATNQDAVGHMTDLQEWPGAGCMVAALRGSTEREPIVVGKPSTFMMDFLLQKFNISTSKMCMVGDRLDTDILFGQSSGCKTLLVLSGVTTETLLHSPSNQIKPDYYTTQVSDFIGFLGS
ncbi:unnamed protein product [Linum tenue]|uniref:phosphoglycolate phosphatase n=1 Tax=Linum tenue TaxID=586396 RepID=A0AAV0GML5_9ROSI|nr:unnamed protein product [Linum tenue]